MYSGLFAWLLCFVYGSVHNVDIDLNRAVDDAFGVGLVEQVYKDLHGDEKLNEALTAASAMLAEKGITITDLELRVLIEAALAEFNGAFEKPGSPAGTEGITQ